MKITLESTSRIVDVNGNPGRVWEGMSESGLPVIACITLIAARADANPEQLEVFNRELLEVRAPSRAAEQVFPLRMVL